MRPQMKIKDRCEVRVAVQFNNVNNYQRMTWAAKNNFSRIVLLFALISLSWT